MTVMRSGNLSLKGRITVFNLKNINKIEIGWELMKVFIGSFYRLFFHQGQ
jgi:hypothetical protein